MTCLLENLITSPDGFGLTKATNCQRAVWRAMSGVDPGELWADEDVRSAFGNRMPPHRAPPKEFLWLAAIRGFKSATASAAAIIATQTADLSALLDTRGELPRFSIVSPSVDLSAPTFYHLVGALTNKPALKALMHGEPTSDSVQIYHPSGRLCEIKVVAGSRAGQALLGRWPIGAVFDEAARMLGEEEASVNLEQSRDALIWRMLPGAQIIYISSAFTKSGPYFQMFQEGFGAPTKDRVVAKTEGRLCNPDHWNQARYREGEAATDDETRRSFLMHCKCEFIDPDTSIFGDALDECFRPASEPPPYLPLQDYVAAMDPAFKKNGWTFCIMTSPGYREGTLDRLDEIVVAREWRGSRREPLSARSVLQEIAQLCAAYHIDFIYTDQYQLEALQALSEEMDIGLLQDDTSVEAAGTSLDDLAARVEQRTVSFLNVPHFRDDMVGTKRRLTSLAGKDFTKAVLPTTRDGRHGDYMATLLRLIAHLPELPATKKPVDEAFVARLEQEEQVRSDEPWERLGEQVWN
jgi:hypothetical protein